MNLQEIVNFGECGYIEYKSEWYWDLNTNSPKDTDWGEFIKDVLALINANSSSIEKTRYLVIGYDESNNDYYNFNLTDENYPNLSKKMKDKLRNFISEFSKIKFKLELKKTNKGNIILISIEQPIMLHALSKNIKTRTIEYPKNTVLGRVHNEGNYGKYDSVGILSEEEKEEIKSKLQQPLNNFSTKRRKKSIQATINSYLEVNNSFKLNNDTSKNSDELDKYYEFYELIGTSEQYFLYISDISIKATIDKFKKDIFSKLDNKLIELIVLTDAPKETTKNRRKENLEKYLKESKINHFKIHFIDDFGKDFLYRDHIEPFLFDKDYQNTKYFIDSHVTSKERPSEELKASEVISSWFQEEDNPVIVLTGEGGIGKTTLAKYFLNNTLKNLTDDKQYVLFLDSATLVGKLKESRIHSIYDLYKVDTDEKKSPSFTDSLFKLSIDNGSFIIVLDGLDEIISKLGDDFQLISFLERIYQDYCFNLSKTKIIITCRDSVWEETVSGKKIAHLPPKSIYSMKAFNFEQVEEFFRTCFKNEQDSEKLEKKAKSFVEKLITTTGNKSNENIYSPFILDRIREIILDNISEQELENLFDDSYNLDSLCFSKSNRNDYFIYSVCKREIIKTQITVEDQIKLLCSLCKYNDLLSHYEFCNELKNILNRKATKQDEHSFISHPFIYSNDSRTKIGLKYDFLKDFFSKILIAQYLTSESNIIDDGALNILVDNAGYLNVFSRAIGKKIIECNHNIENVTLNILNNIDVLNKKNQEIDIEIDKKQNYKVISSLFLIYLSILFEEGRLNSQENLNDALKEIFGQVSSNKILNLCLCDTQNLSTTPKLKFDFSDLEIENFYIKDYNEFFNCIFNEKTLFKNGKISFSSYEKRKNYPFNKNHFINCQFSSSMEELLNNISDSSENKKKNKEKILFDFVRKFHDSGRFKPKKQSEIRAKQGQYVDAMLEAGIIIPHDKTKLNEPEYIINPEYDDDLLESLNNNAVNMNIRRMLKNIKL